MAGFVDLAALFGDNLARLRKRADLSQEELAVMSSLHRTEISNLERGLRLPRIDTVIKLAASLEASTEELLAGIGWQPGEVRRGEFGSTEEG